MLKYIYNEIDVLDDIALTVSDLEDGLDIFSEQLDAVDEDLSNLEDYVYDDEEDYEDEDDEVYEVTCPACNDIVYLDEDNHTGVAKFIKYMKINHLGGGSACSAFVTCIMWRP